ncbi:PAS domain-containing sensor histidine kinase [Nitrospira sp. BLG_2]|uniref:PAS domain-containing sensor histidine kinase n=1 Tax=Nitrospira sp. BLG_2 TaxID=3397507 RepID=UPI003B9D1F6D
MVQKSGLLSPGQADLRRRLNRFPQATHADIPIPLHCTHQLDKLLTELSVASVGLLGEAVDDVLIDTLRRLVEDLGADRSVFGFFTIGSKELTMTHCYARPDIPRVPALDMTQKFPWLFEELGCGEAVRFSRPDDLPLKAAALRRYCRQQGLRSGLILPLCTYGPTRFALAVSSLTKNRLWPNSILRPIWLIGNLLAGAVIRRKQEEDRQREIDLKLAQEHQLRSTIIESLPGNFFMIDIHGRLVRWNHNMEHVYGFSSQELSGMKTAKWLIPEDRDKHETMVKTCFRMGSAVCTYQGRTKDGRCIPFHTRAVRTRIGNEFYIMGVESDISEQKRTEDQLRLLSSCLIGNQEKERHRLAQELHDDISQRLALVAAQLELFLRTPRDGDIDHSVSIRSTDRILDNIRALASDVHKMAYGLHPAKLDQLGLPAALRSLCRDIGNLKRLRIRCSVEDIGKELPPPIALCFYRLAQESLHNVIKHSEATEVSLKLDVQGSELHLVVTDNGVGFDPPESESIHSGLGIISMKERLRQISGAFLLQSKPGQGTRVEAHVPWTRSSNR